MPNMKAEDYNWDCAWCGREIDLNIQKAPALTFAKGPGAILRHTSDWRIFYLFSGEKEIPFYIRPIDLAEDFDIITVLCSEECKESVKAVLNKFMIGLNCN